MAAAFRLAAMEHAPRRRVDPGPRFPNWLVATLTATLFVVLASLYVLSLHLAIDFIGSTDPDEAADTRDARYFLVHGIWVLVALLGGVGLGIWFRRSAFAFATLFVVGILFTAVAAQVITFELACQGHNDIIRHWQC